MASEITSNPSLWLDKLQLYSGSRELFEAHKRVFSDARYSGLVEIENTEKLISKLELTPNSALIVPGNSFGFLTQNDLHTRAIELYGDKLQDNIISVIKEKHDGELLVGQSLLLPLPTSPSYMIYTPTHRVASANENKMSAFLSLRAVLLRVRKHNLRAESTRIKRLVICDLLAQGPMVRIAVQMKVAIDAILFNKCPIFQCPTSLPRPLSLDVALSKLQDFLELDLNSYLINCML